MILLLPVKKYQEAKSRLSNFLALQEREKLAQALFEDTLDVIKSVDGLELIVCTAEETAIQTAQEQGLQVFSEGQTLGLNPALNRAIDRVVGQQNRSIGIIPVDLPHLTTNDLRMFTTMDMPTLAPDSEGQGTNGLKFKSNKRPSLQYGPESASYHLKSLGPETRIFANAGFAFDLDTPNDFNQIDIHKCGPRVAQFLSHRRAAA